MNFNRQLDVTNEYNMGPDSLVYLKYKALFDYLPLEIVCVIFSHLDEAETSYNLSGGVDEESESDCPWSDYDSEYDFELYGNAELGRVDDYEVKDADDYEYDYGHECED